MSPEYLESNALYEAINQSGFPLIGLQGLVQLQLVVFFHRVGDGLVSVGPHLYSTKFLVII